MEQGTEETGAGAKQNQKLFGVNADEFAMMIRMFFENQDQAKQLVEMFSPVVGEALDLVLDAIGPQVSKVALRISLGKAENRMEVREKYLALGFTRAETIAFMLADIGAMDKASSVLANGASSATKK